MTELWGQGLQVLRTEEGGMVEMDRGRWDGALSSHLLEISPSLRPHPHTPPARLATPPQLAGKRSQPYPPHKPIAYRCSRERGGVERREGGKGVQRRKTEGRRGDSRKGEREMLWSGAEACEDGETTGEREKT